jgi:hypothetical protein
MPKAGIRKVEIEKRKEAEPAVVGGRSIEN